MSNPRDDGPASARIPLLPAVSLGSTEKAPQKTTKVQKSGFMQFQNKSPSMFILSQFLSLKDRINVTATTRGFRTNFPLLPYEGEINFLIELNKEPGNQRRIYGLAKQLFHRITMDLALPIDTNNVARDYKHSITDITDNSSWRTPIAHFCCRLASNPTKAKVIWAEKEARIPSFLLAPFVAVASAIGLGTTAPVGACAAVAMSFCASPFCSYSLCVGYQTQHTVGKEVFKKINAIEMKRDDFDQQYEKFLSLQKIFAPKTEILVKLIADCTPKELSSGNGISSSQTNNEAAPTPPAASTAIAARPTTPPSPSVSRSMFTMHGGAASSTAPTTDLSRNSPEDNFRQSVANLVNEYPDHPILKPLFVDLTSIQLIPLRKKITTAISALRNASTVSVSLDITPNDELRVKLIALDRELSIILQNKNPPNPTPKHLSS